MTKTAGVIKMRIATHKNITILGSPMHHYSVYEGKVYLGCITRTGEMSPVDCADYEYWISSDDGMCGIWADKITEYER